MPNHITNIMTFNTDDERRQEILEAIKNDEAGIGSIDFNKIIPMPESIYRGDLGQKEKELYGKNNWYDWSCANWGTKWNAYNCDFDGDQMRFDTAWCRPTPIYEKLSEMFPDVEIECKWADEDFGFNCGTADYKGGENTGLYIPEGGSNEAIELAGDIHGYNPYDENEEMDMQ